MSTNGTTNGAAGDHTSHNMAPKIILYTNHRCPYAQRAHITLSELNLPYEEVIIDLDKPREQSYLEVNPRGLVPSIKYSVPGIMDEEIVTESEIVARFLCDSFPSHLMPASKESPTSALTRARINFFVDTFNTKVMPLQMPLIRATSAEEKQQKIDEIVAAIEKEIEPLLKNAKPFFGGSKELTFAEVIPAPMILRWYALGNDGEIIPKSLVEKLDALPNFSKWAKAIHERPSVTEVWDPQGTVEAMKARMEKMRASAK